MTMTMTDKTMKVCIVISYTVRSAQIIMSKWKYARASSMHDYVRIQTTIDKNY